MSLLARMKLCALGVSFALLVVGCAPRVSIVSEAQPGGIYQHAFAPDYVNYAVCKDTLVALWGKNQGSKIQLYVSWSTQPLLWNGTKAAGTTDTAGLSTWGSIPADLPFDFDCRQALLTPTTQSKHYEIFQSPVQSPFRCSSLYETWLTIVDRKARKAFLTAMPVNPQAEILEWKGTLYIGDTSGLYQVDAANLAKDTDEDGLTDLLEQMIGTTMDEKDSDQDGIPDALDAQPQASEREWSAQDSIAAQNIITQLAAYKGQGACAQFVNIVAPGYDPMQLPAPAPLRLLWNVPFWKGDSLVVPGSP